MAGNSGGPWGGGGGNGRDSGKEGGRKQPTGGKNKPEGSNPVPPEIDDMLRKGQEQLRVLMGGRGSGGSNGSGRGSSGGGLGRSGYFLIVAGLVVFWLLIVCIRYKTMKNRLNYSLEDTLKLVKRV